MTNSMIVPCVRVLKNTLTNLSQTYLSRFVSAIKDCANRRLSSCEEQDAFLLVSALNPNFKLKWCKNTEYSTIKVE